MRDVQSEFDERKICIDRVGLRSVKIPLAILCRSGELQNTVAELDVAVDLPHRFRGTHMSRLFEEVAPFQARLWLDTLPDLLAALRERLEANTAFVRISFPFFINKAAPVTGTVGALSYFCTFGGKCDENGADITLEVNVPVTTLCPCSRAMSSKGAHNQRGIIKVVMRFSDPPWIEDLVELVEACGSCGVYSVLKRPDEKFVTERAYSRPRFVEDVVREVAQKLQAADNVLWFAVEAESQESIHDHNAYAFIKRDKREPNAWTGSDE